MCRILSYSCTLPIDCMINSTVKLFQFVWLDNFFAFFEAAFCVALPFHDQWDKLQSYGLVSLTHCGLVTPYGVI